MVWSLALCPDDTKYSSYDSKSGLLVGLELRVVRALATINTELYMVLVVRFGVSGVCKEKSERI